jgi:outer membrane protein assembly factor BamB
MSTMIRRSFFAALVCAVSFPLVAAQLSALARSGLVLEPSIGPPTTIGKVKGVGYAGREVVAFYFDGISDPDQFDPSIVFGDGGGNIYAIDTTDAFPPPIWQAALGGPIDGPPVLANGVVYAGTNPGGGNPHIFALDQATGRVLFDGLLPGAVASEPIVADGRLVVATASGDVVSYQGPDT